MLILGTRLSILGARIGSVKHLKKPVLDVSHYSSICAVQSNKGYVLLQQTVQHV